MEWTNVTQVSFVSYFWQNFSSILLQKYFWLKEWGRSIYKKASWAKIEVDDEKQL